MFLVFDSLRRRFLWLLGRSVSHFTLTRQTILRFVTSYRLYARNLTPQASLLDRGEMILNTSALHLVGSGAISAYVLCQGVPARSSGLKSLAPSRITV